MKSNRLWHRPVNTEVTVTSPSSNHTVTHIICFKWWNNISLSRLLLGPTSEWSSQPPTIYNLLQLGAKYLSDGTKSGYKSPDMWKGRASKRVLPSLRHQSWSHRAGATELEPQSWSHRAPAEDSTRSSSVSSSSSSSSNQACRRNGGTFWRVQ